VLVFFTNIFFAPINVLVKNTITGVQNTSMSTQNTSAGTVNR
jgi:hypothetical protein